MIVYRNNSADKNIQLNYDMTPRLHCVQIVSLGDTKPLNNAVLQTKTSRMYTACLNFFPEHLILFSPHSLSSDR